jgi:LmbE family N-acetylglucosaminyl deacetylase
MLALRFLKDSALPLRILCLGAHSDDIEIGCGGTILRLLEQYESAEVHWIVLSSNQQRSEEARRSAEGLLCSAKSKQVIIKDFKDGFFPYYGSEIKTFFEEFKNLVSPDLIFTHYRQDLHQDHRMICELTWNTWRDHLILEYEVPKYDGDFGNPNFFVTLTEAHCRKKLQRIVESFQTQQAKHWFAEETFLSVLRLRGMECRATSKYAEAFYCRKILFDHGWEPSAARTVPLNS